MNSQRLRQHPQGLHKSKPDGVPVLKDVSRHYLLSQTKKLPSIDICLQGKIYFFSNGVSLGIISTLKGMPQTQLQMPTQNKLSVISVDFLCHLAFFRHFIFCPTDLLLVYSGFLFCFDMSFLVVCFSFGVCFSCFFFYCFVF